MGIQSTGGTTVPATREDYETFVNAADEAGYPSLGTDAMFCFELCQRPGDTYGKIGWNCRAIKQGEEKAMNNLGFMYVNGNGVPKDDAKP
jgi:TPR repeat protein